MKKDEIICYMYCYNTTIIWRSTLQQNKIKECGDNCNAFKQTFEDIMNTLINKINNANKYLGKLKTPRKKTLLVMQMSTVTSKTKINSKKI